jgi:hypothetical protein
MLSSNELTTALVARRSFNVVDATEILVSIA